MNIKNSLQDIYIVYLAKRLKMAAKAIAVFNGKIRGKVVFTEYIDLGMVEIEVDLVGLTRNGVHGFHIHKYGDISEGCASMCEHYNPYNKKHGGPGSKHRHLGDLGNIEADSYGRVRTIIIDRGIKLHGSRANIVGRGLVIHANADDLGLGGNEESLVTGNAGKRIACAVIGHARP
jgi:Cu-Zn family superoxide dismutase